MKQYEVQLRWGYKITPIEVEKETESSVWVNGRRRAKATAYDQIFKTLPEAKKFMISRCEREIAEYEKRISEAREALIDFKA
jgi:hypothetical protein